MPKITSKGQITIPQVIRNKFGFMIGMDVEIIIEGNKALIVKSRDENKFMLFISIMPRLILGRITQPPAFHPLFH